MKFERIVIKVADYRNSFKFYHDTLSLHLKNSWQRKDSWGAIFQCGEIILEMIWFPKGENNLDCSYIPERTKTDLYFTVSNIESEYQKLSRIEGLDISPPEDTAEGYRIFSVYDPDRIKIVFAQPI